MDLTISNATLPNGLRVVLVRDPRARDLQVTMRYAVGDVDDPPGQEGIAHLVEHLMFQQIVGAESIFAKLEAQAHAFNAFTSHDATTYITRAAPDQLEALLAIEGVRVGLRCASISASAFERERAVVVNELRMRGKLDELLTAFMRGVYTPTHPYARAADPARVGELTMAQACAFADAHYAPTNAVLVLSGNLADETASAALAKMLGRVPRRDAVAPAKVPTASAGVVTQKAPLSHDAVLVAWPLPADPAAQARARAVFGVVAEYVDSQVAGRVYSMSLGDERAPMAALLIINADKETSLEVLAQVKRGVDEAPGAFRLPGTWGEFFFHAIQQGALYNTFSGLEDGSQRDSELAAQVLAGRDPRRALSAQLHSLSTLTPGEAATLVTATFPLERASVSVLEAEDKTRGGAEDIVAKPVHDIGQHRDVPDPADATRPVSEPLTVEPPAEMQSRTLPNGLRVVLLPVSSVPAVDARIVFAAGTADEPADKRGSAMIAARALAWAGDSDSLESLLALAEAGGSTDVDVTADHVAFAVHGLDMHLDYLLTGLQRRIVHGTYKGGASYMARVLRAQSKREGDAGAIADAYREARFGAEHPYTAAGLARHVSDHLSLDDAKAFRAAHFTPDNATLVIAGRFDPALANRWIDYLFAGWKGTAVARAGARAEVHPASLASDEDLAQVQLDMTLPATAGTRAARAVAAAMLTEIVEDVRHQLGAAYVFDAGYDERRLSTTYRIGGATDAPRTHEAIALIRDRLAALRATPELAARAFVTARKRALTRLSASAGSASELGATVSRDLGIGRGLFGDALLAQEVHELTVDQMAPVLDELDLARAAIMMRGPVADTTRAFAELGRTATQLSAEPLPKIEYGAQDTSFAGLTEERSNERFLVGIDVNYLRGKTKGVWLGGRAFAAHLGLNIENSVTAGVTLAYGTVAGEHHVQYMGTQPLELESIGAGIFVQRTIANRFWVDVLFGYRFDGLTEIGDVGQLWHNGLSVGLEVGVDVLRWRKHRLTATARYETELESYAEYSGLTFGVGYRFY